MNTKYDKTRLVVLGAGESGVGAAILGKDKGMDVWVSDSGSIRDKYKKELESEDIPYEENGHNRTRVLEADLVVKSPGIPLTAPLVMELTEKGVPVVSEIEFASRYTDARMICITGSNGKTTTTMLTHHILTNAGIDASLAGNIGYSLARQVARSPKPVYVIELSSFQLDNMYDFHADIAVLLNITPDHLDRYNHSMEAYGEAKLRIGRNQRPQDAFIYWASDPWTLRLLDRLPGEATRFPFDDAALSPDTDSGNAGIPAAYRTGDGIIVKAGGAELRMPVAELALRGRHNLYNSLAAATVGLLMGVTPDVVRSAMHSFSPVEHRLEPAGCINGAEYINDSKATNVDSTFYALEAMTRPVILILGGKDKGNDYSQIEKLVVEKVKAVVCMGVDNSKLLKFFTGKVPEIADTHSLQDAMQACLSLSKEGDVVLLSPACASFDLFSSYEDRGRQFKNAVKSLKSTLA